MAKGKGAILVTGATGQQGGAVARELLARKHTVRAMTRKPDSDAAKALARQGAEVVKGDLDDAESLRRALQGAWGVFAVQNTWEAGVEGVETQGKRIAELARKAGVQHYVYTSVGSAHRTDRAGARLPIPRHSSPGVLHGQLSLAVVQARHRSGQADDRPQADHG